MTEKKQRVLFVCYGNICRSPSAQGIFEHIASQRNISHLFEVDSAGTHDFHIGKQPDVRAIKTAKKHGVDLSIQKARQLKAKDFDDFDHIFVMDKRNEEFAIALAPRSQHHKITEFIRFKNDSALDKVPDPFHGQLEDFDEMMTLLFELCENALDSLSKGIINTKA